MQVETLRSRALWHRAAGVFRYLFRKTHFGRALWHGSHRLGDDLVPHALSDCVSCEAEEQVDNLVSVAVAKLLGEKALVLDDKIVRRGAPENGKDRDNMIDIESSREGSGKEGQRGSRIDRRDPFILLPASDQGDGKYAPHGFTSRAGWSSGTSAACAGCRNCRTGR